MDEQYYEETGGDFEELISRCFRCGREYAYTEMNPVYDEYLECLFDGDGSYYSDEDDEFKEPACIYLCDECCCIEDEEG